MMARGLCIVILMAVATVFVNGQGVVPGIPNICFEPAESGVCRAFIPSFYFNPLTGACDCFIYGGCRGNNNRFANIADCMSGCSVRPELQFNTPSCDRIFGKDNPLTSSAPRQGPSPPQNQTQPIGIQLPIPQQPETQTEQPAAQPEQTTETQPEESAPQPQEPVIIVIEPKESAAQPENPVTQPEESAAQPEESAAQPEESAAQPEESAAETETQPKESEGESSSNNNNSLGSRTIASLVIGTTGVRPGTLTIGQPVFVSFNKPKQQTNEEEVEE